MPEASVNALAFENYYQRISKNYSFTGKGVFYIHDVDLVVNGPTMPLVFERAYVCSLSNLKIAGIQSNLGQGWFSNYESFLVYQQKDHIKFYDFRNLSAPSSNTLRSYILDYTYESKNGEFKYILNEDKAEFFIRDTDGTFTLYDTSGMLYKFN